jgi:cytochrome c oxidase accessory protein FixG
VTTLAILLIPFIRINGDSLLRLDFATLTLHFAGTILPIEALWLFLLLCLALMLLFLLVTLAFGRAWCGWACPQTTLVDWVEWCVRKLGGRVAAGQLTVSPVQNLARHLICLLLALLVGANLTWYFVAPPEFFQHLLVGTLHWSAWALFVGTAATVWLDLALLRRLFCKEFCPYGRFQTVLFDPGTLTLRFHPDEAPRCIRCGACVRACPTGIDIRNGYQIECINCGRCLDACREVMARRAQAGTIRYTFGLEGRGGRALLNIRMGLVTMVFLATLIGLLVAASQHSPVTLKVARNAVLFPRTVNGERVLNFFTAYLVNRGREPQTISFSVTPGAFAVQWRGPAGSLQLAAGEHRRIDFGLEAAAVELSQPRQIQLTLRDTTGTALASTSLTLIGDLDKPASNQAQ